MRDIAQINSDLVSMRSEAGIPDESHQTLLSYEDDDRDNPFDEETRKCIRLHAQHTAHIFYCQITLAMCCILMIKPLLYLVLITCSQKIGTLPNGNNSLV